MCAFLVFLETLVPWVFPLFPEFPFLLTLFLSCYQVRLLRTDFIQSMRLRRQGRCRMRYRRGLGFWEFVSVFSGHPEGVDWECPFYLWTLSSDGSDICRCSSCGSQVDWRFYSRACFRRTWGCDEKPLVRVRDLCGVSRSVVIQLLTCPCLGDTYPLGFSERWSAVATWFYSIICLLPFIFGFSFHYLFSSFISLSWAFLRSCQSICVSFTLPRYLTLYPQISDHLHSHLAIRTHHRRRLPLRPRLGYTVQQGR